MSEPVKTKEEMEAVIKILLKVIKAQQAFLIAYRVGKRPPEWAFNDLDRARKAGIDSSRSINVLKVKNANLQTQ